MKFDEYKELFPSPATTDWEYNENSSGTIVVTTPNGFDFDISPENFARPNVWNEIYEHEHFSTRLWVRSLWYCTQLAEHGRFSEVEYVLKSYHQFILDRDLDPDRFGMNSFDHCLGLNVRTCAYLAVLLSEKREQKDLLTFVNELTVDLFTVIKRYDHFLKDNHGLMLTLGLLHGIYALGRDDLPFDLSFCSTFIGEVFDEVVDGSGLVFENTPDYQAHWISWANEVSKTLSSLFVLNRESERYAEVALKIEENYRRFIIDEEHVLPIGDGVAQVQSQLEPLPGFYFNSIGGQTIWNNGEGYVFAYVAGTKSGIHKHVDDLSLRWWIGGTELFIDGGALSYDLADPVSRCLSSQRGHTGLFFPKFDMDPGPTMYPWDEHDRFVTSSSFSSMLGDKLVINSRKSHHSGETLQRVVHFDTEKQVMDLFDSATAEIGDSVPVARFLVSSDFSVNYHGHEITLEDDGLQVSITALESGIVRVREAAEFLDLTAIRNKEDKEIIGLRMGGRGIVESCHAIDVELKSDESNCWKSQIQVTVKEVKPVACHIGSAVGREILSTLPALAEHRIQPLRFAGSDDLNNEKTGQHSIQSLLEFGLAAHSAALSVRETSVDFATFDFLKEALVGLGNGQILDEPRDEGFSKSNLRNTSRPIRGLKSAEFTVVMKYFLQMVVRFNRELLERGGLTILKLYLPQKVNGIKAEKDPIFANLYSQEAVRINKILDELYTYATELGLGHIDSELPDGFEAYNSWDDDVLWERKLMR